YNISALTIEFIIGIRTLGDLDPTKIAYPNGGLKACLRCRHTKRIVQIYLYDH
ncbi:hypothetical protein AAJ76_501000842, partial [Vairimorpha ceranae]